MKRSIALFLVTAMVLVLGASAFAKTQDFDNFSVYYVPTRHTATQASSVVTITEDKVPANWVSIEIRELGSTTDVMGNTTARTLYSLANSFYRAYFVDRFDNIGGAAPADSLVNAEAAGLPVNYDGIDANGLPDIDAVSNANTGATASTIINFPYVDGRGTATSPFVTMDFTIFTSGFNPTLPAGTVCIIRSTKTFNGKANSVFVNGVDAFVDDASLGVGTANNGKWDDTQIGGVAAAFNQIFNAVDTVDVGVFVPDFAAAPLTNTNYYVRAGGAFTNSEAFNQVLFSLVFKNAQYKKDFTKVSVANIAEGWRNGEEDNKNVVIIAKDDDKDAFVKIEVRKKDNVGFRINDMGDTLRDEVNGVFRYSVSGLYFFTYTSTGAYTVGEYVFDSNYDANLPEGYYCILQRSWKGGFYAAPGVGLTEDPHNSIEPSVAYKDFNFLRSTITFHPETEAEVATKVDSITDTTTRTTVTDALIAEYASKDVTITADDVNFVAQTDIHDAIAPEESVVKELTAQGYSIVENIAAIQVGTVDVGSKGIQVFEVTPGDKVKSMDVAGLQLIATRREGGVGGSGYTWVDAAALSDVKGINEVAMRDTAGAKLTSGTVPASFIGTVELNTAGRYGLHFVGSSSPTPDTKSQDVTPTPTPTPKSEDQSGDEEFGSSSSSGCVAGTGSIAALAVLLALSLRKRGC